MDSFQVIYTIFVTVLLTYTTDVCMADHEYMLKKAEAISVPLTFETRLTCQMNIPPDKFQWKFYPYNMTNVYDSKATISLSSPSYEFIKSPNAFYKINSQKWTSDLIIRANSEKVAGEYQCLAYYGAFVVASVPWKITIAKLDNFPEQNNIDVTVVAGNTVNWRCEPPPSNPEPYVDYYRDGKIYKKPTSSMKTKFLVIPNVTTSDTGQYRCKVGNTLTFTTISGPVLNLKVVKNSPPQPPRFIMSPKKEYEVVKGGTVFMECAAVGSPVPRVVWMREDNGIIPKGRSDMVEGGLIIRNVTKSDGGVYSCTQKNSEGTVSHRISLIYLEPPRIDCFSNSTDVKQGENVDLDCEVSGVPPPEISWFLNGFVVDDSAISTAGNEIHFRPVEKKHAGNLQIFARNVVQTVNSSISIRVIPLSTTQEGSNMDNPLPPVTRGHRKGGRKSQKHAKMIPPSKPMISRVNDEAVLVRWSVPNNKGLPIQFFKVQYRELGPATHNNDHHTRVKSSKWSTSNTDIPPHINSYEVNGLKPDNWYRFRIAAVYSNSDNRNSMISEKFHLKRLDFDKKNPLPIPMITKTETVNSTSVKIYWMYDPTPNITVEGFVVNYNSASSADDYMKESVDDPNTTSYILSHLQPDTVYDIKLQTFTSRSASEFSSIMKAKTLGIATTTPSAIRDSSAPSSISESTGISKLYIVIAGGVLGGFAVIFGIIVLLIFCRKWKQGKNGDRNKSDDHHIQVDGNEYVVGPKGAQRANGCVSSNRITITANPLADADNKNQNMIEMSCLSSQNNNCSSATTATTVQPSVSGEDTPSTNSRDNKKKHNKNREKRIRNKIDGENYV